MYRNIQTLGLPSGFFDAEINENLKVKKHCMATCTIFPVDDDARTFFRAIT